MEITVVWGREKVSKEKKKEVEGGIIEKKSGCVIGFKKKEGRGGEAELVKTSETVRRRGGVKET